MSSDILPDVLQPGLKVVFCGMAAGKKSARVGAYYAGPGNRFWGMLYEVGLTPYPLAPGAFRDAVRFGIGLTDMVKTQVGNDNELDLKHADPSRVRASMLEYQPGVLAFSSKRAGQLFFGSAQLDYGLQAEKLGSTAIWVLPSTSRANAHWPKLAYAWHDLARYLNRPETGGE